MFPSLPIPRKIATLPQLSAPPITSNATSKPYNTVYNGHCVNLHGNNNSKF